MNLVVALPWGAWIGPFALSQYSALPKRSIEYLPKFFDDTNQDPYDHIKETTVTYGILGVQEVNIFVRLFAGSLIGSVANWFQNLYNGRITCWSDLEVKFLQRFRPTVDVAKLLLNLFQIQKKEIEPKRDFVDRFNRCVGKIPQNSQPNENNQLCIFIVALQIKMKFLLKHQKLQTLQDALREAISLDDDMFLSGMKCKEIAHVGIYIYEQQNYPK